MIAAYPGLAVNPEDRPVKPVRTVRFERWPKPTEKNPNPEVETVPLQLESVADTGDGFPGVIGRAVIRGTPYATALSGHDLQWALAEVVREVDLARARDAVR